MARQFENQIREALGRVANNHLSLDDFRNWFVPVSWNIEGSGEPEAIDLAHRIDGVLAEASAVGWSEQDIREELSTLFAPSAGTKRAEKSLP
jgi:hypothetical protein